MLELLTVAGLSAGAEHLVKEVLGPLTKAAAEDFCKDFLKQCVSDGLAQAAPEPLKKGIARSLKAFLVLFQAELENCGLPGDLAYHEFAPPLKQLLKDSSVRQFLGTAFATEVKTLDDTFLSEKWAQLGAQLPEDFDWAQLTKNYVRRVKGIVKGDEALARQLELDFQERTEANTAEILGVKVDFDLKAYQESLRERYGRLSLDSLDSTGAAYNDLRLWKIFVPQDVRECAEFAPQMYELPKERLIQLEAAGEIGALLSLEALETRRQGYAEQPLEPVADVVGLKGTARQLRTVILGDPGSGKSTLLQAIALEWTEQTAGARRGQRGKPLPILIELRLYAQDKDAGKCNSFLEYLHQGNNFCRLNQLALDKLLKSGEVVALFDGVDEVFDPRLREAVVNDIHRFSNRYSQVQMVVTSRWLGYKAETLRNADFRHYMLQDLNDEQMAAFVEKWHQLTFEAGRQAESGRKQARLQKAIAESKPIRELAGNPLLLTMMAILNRNQELPRDRARLYERASEVLLHQWDVERKVHEVPALKNWQIDVRDKQAMLRKVAHHMQANEQGLSGNVISRGDLEQILMDYLKTLEVEQARPVARIMIEQLRERNFILCYLGADNYAFVHRTFLEYFCASEFVWQFEKERTLEREDLKALYGAHFQEESWDEVLRLMAGMVEPRFVGEIIEDLLLQDVEKSDFVRYADHPFNFMAYLQKGGVSNLLLAADCLAEVRNRSEIGEPVSQLLIELQRAIINDYPYSLEDDTAFALLNAISTHWKDDSVIFPWVKQCLSLHNVNVRTSTVQVIARSWKEDPETLPWLKQRAQEDEEWSVRRASVQELARGWKEDPETLPWLKQRAQEDEDWSVRSASVQELARGWKEDPETLPILKQRAQEDEDADVRSASVQELARGWKEDTSLFDLWCDRALQDPFKREYDWQDNPRQIALNVLVKQYPTHPKTTELLQDRSQNDTDEKLRNWATQQLTRLNSPLNPK